jgi:hypothetical protein
MATLSNIEQSLVPSEPELIDLLNLFEKKIRLNLNCHHIGTIQSFDPSDQTASATINYTKTFFTVNPETGLYISTTQDFPIISQAPVIVLGGATTALTFPIATGDECLVLFNDRDLDNWFTGGTGSPNATARLHSFSDALIIVGLRSMNNSLENYDSIRALLRAGDTANSITAVGVNPNNSKVLITNKYPANTTTLNTLLAQLIGNIKDLVTAVNAITVTTTVVVPATPFTGPFPSLTPNNSAQISAVTTALMTTTNDIAQLLE